MAGGRNYSRLVNMEKGDWNDVDLREFLGAVGVSISIGLVRFLYLLRRGRQFHWFDVVLEPALAVFGGLCMWALMEVSAAPDMLQAVITSLGAWGGPRTIHWLEVRYMGGSRATDYSTLDEGKK